MFNEALHRAQAAALEPKFAALREKQDAEVSLDVLQVGAGAGTWVSSFDLAKTRFTVVDVHGDLRETARASFPEGRFDRLGSEYLFPYDDESFDLAFSVTVMHHNPAPTKRTLISEMWRVIRPGGRLLFLENLVFSKQLEGPAAYPMSVTGFVELIIDATAGQVVLEHVESLQYPGEYIRRGGVLALLRLGT